MMASSIPSQFNLKPPYPQHHTSLNASFDVNPTVIPTKPRRRRRKSPTYPHISTHFCIHNKDVIFKPNSCSFRTVVTRVSGDDSGGSATGASSRQQSTNVEETNSNSSTLGDHYVALFVRMLGLDNDPLDREQSIVALWKYSLGGKKCIDNIMQFQGSINLTVNLLKSESSSTREAAAGLLRSISSINQYRDVVAESGAVEEIISLLSHPSLPPDVKEQSLCTLWNLSVDEKLRVKIAKRDIVQLLVKSLEDEDIRVKEAAGGILANLALTHSNHDAMVEAGIIPKLAKFLEGDVQEELKVIRKEARNALLKLAKNEYYRILIIEEGVVPVPLVGTAAYNSYTPGLHSWPSLPDGTGIERMSRGPSRFGASELLLGLNIDDNNANLDEAKMKAMIARSKQQFLARSGSIEVEDAKSSQTESSSLRQFTLLPWIDGVARLVLILELEEELAVSRAAQSIGDASINEHMRNAFKEAGAIKHLIRLLDHNNVSIRLAAIGALERLSISYGVCRIIEAEGAICPLINILKNSESSESMMEKALDLLARILDPNKEMKSKLYNGPGNGSKKELEGSHANMGLNLKVNEMPMGRTNNRQNLLDSSVTARLVEMLKYSSPSLQRKAASVLEFAVIDIDMETVVLKNIEDGLDALFEQKVLTDEGSDTESQQPEQHALQVEEAGLAISAASRLLTKLLDSEKFRGSINSSHFTKLLRNILKSKIPLHHKDWVAACLVKLSYLYGPSIQPENPIHMEVTIYETIPRLIEHISSSFSPETQEAAVMELNRIVSEGVVDATGSVASNGGIFPLVKLIGEGSERAVEAALSVLYNLSMDEENHSAIIAAGAVPVLRRIILSERPQWKRALRLLRTLPT